MTPTVVVDSSFSHEFEPDVIHVRVSMSGTASSKPKAVNKYNRSLEAVLSALEEAGISRDEVKNSYFSVYQPWSKKDREKWPYEYDATQTFDIDCTEERFGAVWHALLFLDDENSYVSPRFSYDLKDEEGAREQIIRTAVEQGRNRAEKLADAVGCDLGHIVKVENDLDANDAYLRDSSPVFGSTAEPEPREVPEFNPDTIDIDCSVRLEYELVPRT